MEVPCDRNFCAWERLGTLSLRGINDTQKSVPLPRATQRTCEERSMSSCIDLARKESPHLHLFSRGNCDEKRLALSIAQS